MRRKFRWGCVAVTAVALLLSACGGSDEKSGDSSEPYLIMLSGGTNAGPGTASLLTGVNAAKAAVKVVNASGGIGGRKVEIVESQDNADPTKAVPSLRAQLAKKKPDAFLYASNSNVGASVSQILNDNKILFLDSGNSPDANNPEKMPYAFHLSAPTKALAAGFLPTFETNGYKKVGIIHGNSVAGIDFADNAEKVFKEAGYDVVANEQYDATALDMTPQISRIRAQAPDVLVFNGYGAPVGYVLKSLDKLGWDIPIMGDTAVAATPLVTTLPPDGLVGTPSVENLSIEYVSSAIYDPEATNTNDAIKAMKDEGHLDSSLLLCNNYDGIMMLQAAAKIAKSTDTEKMAKALETPEARSTAKLVLYTGGSYSETSHELSLPGTAFTFDSPKVFTYGQVNSPYAK